MFNDPATQIDDLLDKIAEGIQLDPTRKQRMESAYNAVNDWLNSDEIFFKKYPFEVYPQGSVRIGTTIKPLDRDEFDLDTVVHINGDVKKFTPQEIYSQLKRRISENSRYKEMVELKNRCLRLNYSGDFHMDILPGVQQYIHDDQKLVIPDRKLGTWATTNPKGYGGWFLDKANSVIQSLLEKAYALEELPDDDFQSKKPLQRGVQLIKRYRDEFFNGNDEYATSSIVLTTIAGHFYNSEDSIFYTIDNIINKILIESRKTNGRIKVVNPVNPEEDFTDKWDSDPMYHQEFIRFVKHLHQAWQELKTGGKGRIHEDRLIKGLFGEDAYGKGVRIQNELIEKLRSTNKLQVDRKSGILTSGLAIGASSVKANTFYGSGVKDGN